MGGSQPPVSILTLQHNYIHCVLQKQGDRKFIPINGTKIYQRIFYRNKSGERSSRCRMVQNEEKITSFKLSVKSFQVKDVNMNMFNDQLLNYN